VVGGTRYVKTPLAKQLPWVLVITIKDLYSNIPLSSIAYYLMDYVNVVVVELDSIPLRDLIHRGFVRLCFSLLRRGRSIPCYLIRDVCKILNRPVKIDLPKKVPPEMFDLVITGDPITSRLYLKPFRNAIKCYYAYDDPRPWIFLQHTLDAEVHVDYDIVFSAHKKFVKIYENLGAKSYWLPFAADPRINRPWKVNKDLDLLFIGNIPSGSKRARILFELLKWIKGIGKKLSFMIARAFLHDYAYLINRAKIVLNISTWNELTMRIFEVLGSGSFLLTDENEEVKELFIPRQHLDIFKSFEDLKDKILYYLENDSERANIAAQGHKYVYANHTYRHRALFILKTVG